MVPNFLYVINGDKFKILNFQGNVATCLRCGGKYYMGFVGNLVTFTTVKKF